MPGANSSTRARQFFSALPLALLIALLLPAMAEPAHLKAPEAAGQPQVRVIRDEAGLAVQVQEGGPPRFAPGEIIVKFKPAAAETLGRRLGAQLRVDRPQDTGLASVDALNARHGAHALEPVFRALHRRLREGRSPEAVSQQLKARFASRARRAPCGEHVPDLSRIYRITLRADEPLERALADYRQDPQVEYAEPNYVYTAQWVPNDPYYSSSGTWGQPYDDMWGLKAIGMECAWDIALAAGGGVPVTVAVVDTGVDYNHADLAGMMWTNPAEIPGNGIDDDGNGYVDDRYGYDFDSPDSDPVDDCGHGTHVAGTIGAATNNGLGISGIALTARIMALKGMNAGGSGYITSLAEAIYYATDNGADVMNFSWGGEGRSRTLAEALQYAHAHGCVLVAAAGNDALDAAGFTPASEKEVICVAATDHLDAPADYSNWGDIDVAAPGGDGDAGAEPKFPGINVLSLRAHGTDMYHDTLPKTLIVNNNYYRARGTSMAAPHVSGLAALLLSVHPEFSNEQVRQAIRLSADDLGEPGFDDHYGWGRINACAALQAAPPSVAWLTSPALRSMFQGVVEIAGTAAGPDFQGWRLDYAAAGSPEEFFPLAASSNPVTDGVLASWDTGALAPGNYVLKLSVAGGSGRVYEDSVLVHVNESPLQPGWPYDSGNARDGFTASTLADLDGDGHLEVIAATDFSKWLYAFHHDGTLVEGWPVALKTKGELSEGYAPPACADLDKDGRPEVFINTLHGVHGFDAAGNRLPGWPQEKALSFAAPVVLADVNQDSYPEVVCLGHTWGELTKPARLYAWRRNGGLLPGFPVSVGVARQTNLAVGDLDPATPGLEIVVPVCSGETAASVKVYDSQGGELFSCPVPGPAAGHVRYVMVSLGDVNDDGALEIVFLTLLSGNQSSIGVIDGRGNLLSEWKIEEGLLDLSEPVLGNLDADADLEIVATAYHDLGGRKYNRIYAWNHDGSNVTGWPVDAPDASYAPVLADVDGDGDTEVVTSLGWEQLNLDIYAFHHDGAPVAGWSMGFYLWPVLGWRSSGDFRTAIADIDGDGTLELATGLGQGVLAVAEVPGSGPPAALDWPGAYHDVQHRSNYGPDPVAPDQLIPVPFITAIKSATFEPGKVITIQGQGFGEVQGEGLVHIGPKTYDATSSQIRLWSDNAIRVRLPRHACEWFGSSTSRSNNVWVTVQGIDSNRRTIKINRPATCP